MKKAAWPIFILLAAHALAQPPAFEAATIKPSKDRPGHSGSHSRTGMIVLTGQTLKGLICVAYRIRDFQVSGGPKWIDGDRFDVNAKAEGPAEGPQLLVMLQTLLADRFQLVFHHEQKIGPAYALVLAKSGLKIKPVEGATGSNSNGGRGQLTVTGMTMAKFADLIDGRPGAAGALWIHDGVALFSGAATIPELRRRGLQSALLQERMRYAFDHGCDLAMMVAEAGSESQRNAERKGFRIAYTRTKWRLGITD